VTRITLRYVSPCILLFRRLNCRFTSIPIFVVRFFKRTDLRSQFGGDFWIVIGDVGHDESLT